jgi:hypothetical protein
MRWLGTWALLKLAEFACVSSPLAQKHPNNDAAVAGRRLLLFLLTQKGSRTKYILSLPSYAFHKLATRLRPHQLNIYAIRQFYQSQPSLHAVDFENGELGDDLAHSPGPGQGQGAFPNYLGVPLLVAVLHDSNHFGFIWV